MILYDMHIQGTHLDVADCFGSVEMTIDDGYHNPDIRLTLSDAEILANHLLDIVRAKRP